MLCPLLEYLTQQPPDTDDQWRDWHIQAVRGGMNSFIYHGTGPEGECATGPGVNTGRCNF
jgi:hypothetical protein